MMLKNPPLSPEEPSSLVVNAQTPAREGEARAITSTPKSILRNIPKSSVELATSSFKKLRTDTEQTANQLLFTSRLILSNSINIWLISVLVELVYILRVSVPWKRVDLLPLQSHGVSLSIHYAPLATFQSPTFWTILVHWAIPSVIIPVISGSLVSFHPANSPAARMRRARFFDPLTASVMRVAAQYAYPYEALKLSTECVDVLGPHWRLLIASVAAALTFAEAIATAPAAYAEAKLRPRGTPRRAALLEETAS
ncbi:hypothetical protein ID866_4038 [Astraeus odoratus]|nr:hypothetical protein ID866_4038 [Astraeus odoratus]